MSTHRVVGALLLIVGAVVFVAAEACAAAGWTDPSLPCTGFSPGS
jgi:hypothetical protein